MLSKKLIVIAATVALALGATTADAGYRVRVHAKHHHKQAPQCGKDESPMSVEGVEGVFCVKGQACVADIDGECPAPQKGLEFGAYCDEVKTGVMGCKPFKSMKEWEDAHGKEESEEVDDDECAADETEVSVEGVEGVFCVQGPVCVADKKGACPEPQEGLEFGAFCDKVKTGVLGCKPYKSMADWAADHGDHHGHHHDHHEHGDVEDDECDDDDESPMSVEGVEGAFCVKGKACAGDVDGECPVPQEGLEFGSYCGKVKTGVFGCKPYGSWEEWMKDHPDDDSEESEEHDECDDDETEMSVEGVEGIFCVKGQACVANTNGTCPEPQEGLEFGAYCDKVKTGVFGCKPKAAPKTTKQLKKAAHHKQAPKCGKDETPMSVEGVEGAFCVKGQACVADIDGECPVPQKGLEFGAYCDEVKTGVMGCKPYKSWDEWLEDHPEDSEESEEVDDEECADDETEMSVEGVEGIFCVPGQACVANTNGTCPEPQEGLEFGAYCGKVKTGVLGCKPYKSEAERKAGPPKKLHTKFVKGHTKKVVKAHAKKVFKKHHN